MVTRPLFRENQRARGAKPSVGRQVGSMGARYQRTGLKKAIISQVSDVMTALAKPEFAQKMVDRLRATTETGDVQSPVNAVDLAVKELDLREEEKETILTTFIEDRDYSQWGLASAITSVANQEATTYERACELENVGSNVIDLNQLQWNRFVQAEKIAA